MKKFIISILFLCSFSFTAQASFDRSLTTGDSGADVLHLQQLLNKLGKRVTVSGEETTYFGQKTTAAIKTLQCESGIVCEGTLGFGVVGPRTQVLLRSLTNSEGEVLGVSTDGLIAQYSFDEGVGSTTVDSVGRNIGSIKGALWTDGKFGKALKFSTSNDKVSIPRATSPILSEKTITFWAKPAVLKYYLIAYDDVDQMYGGFNASGQFRVNWKNPTGEFKAANIKANAVAGVWQHFSIVYGATSISVYRNGEFVSSTPVLGGIAESKISTIGGRTKSEETFGGGLDEFRIYSRALLANEVTAVYSESIAAVTSPNETQPIQTPPPGPKPILPPPTTLPPVPVVVTIGTYYVDFISGSDTNTGVKESPWKHAPGDPKATSNPAKIVLAPGSTVQFKGGVIYRGLIDVKSSGTAEKPILYKGTWGEGKAIIDGSEPLSGLKKCVSAADCGGNANWPNLYRAPVVIPSYITSDPVLHLNVMSGNEALTVAQEPASTNKFYQAYENFYAVPPANVTNTSLKDSRLAKLGGSSLVGAYVYIWGNPNEVYTRKITGYNATTNTITFDSFMPYPDKDARYAIGNSPNTSVLDTAGEYYVNAAKNEIIVWPLSSSDVSTVTTSVRPYGFNLGSYSNITVDGFLIRKQAGDGEREGQGIVKYDATTAGNYLINNNEIAYGHSSQKGGVIGLLNAENSTISNNFVHDSGGNMRGISISGKNITIKNNHVKNVARTGIYFGEMKTGIIDGNVVEDNNSAHGNGISVYQNSTDIIVSNNRVTRSNIAFTMEQSTNLTLYNNVFDGSKETNFVFADWGGMKGTNYIFNNSIVGSNSGAALLLSSAKTDATYVLKNNIIDGSLTKTVKTAYANNIYVSLSWNQNAKYGWSIESSEKKIADLSSIFVNPTVGDFALKAGSPAIDTGVSLTSYLTTDILGAKRPQGERYDIGAYEYKKP